MGEVNHPTEGNGRLLIEGEQLDVVGVEAVSIPERFAAAAGWSALLAAGTERMQERQQLMLDNLAAFIVTQEDQQPGSIELRDYQQVSFDKLYRHLTGPQFARSPTRHALLHLPTNFGKTIMEAIAFEALGIGTLAADAEPPLSATVFVPTTTLLHQTAARFNTFLPRIPVSKFFGDDKDLGGSIRIMTYKMLDELSDDELDYLHLMSDLFGLDEADCATGPLRSQRVKRLMLGRLTLACTATDGFIDYTGETKGLRTISSTLGIETADYKSPRDALDEGIMNGCQIFLVATGKQAKVTSRRGTLTESDIKSLREEPERDDLIIDIVEMMGEEGRTGLVKCIRGGDEKYDTSAHARHLAERANGMWVVDAKTGQPRQIRAEAIGKFNTRDHRRILEDFEAGKIDALFYTEILTRGLDSTQVQYMVAAEPSTSLTEMIQQFGRGARHKEMLTLYFQLVDQLTGSHRRLCTFLDVVEESADDLIEPGKVIGRPGLGRSGSDSSPGPRPGPGRSPAPGGRRDPTPEEQPDQPGRNAPPAPADEFEPDGRLGLERLPPRLRGSVDVLCGTILADVTIVARQRPPKGWSRPTPLLRAYHIAAASTLLHVLDQYPSEGEDDPPYVQIGSGRGSSYYLNPKAEAWVRKSGLLERGDDRVVKFPDIRTAFGISGVKLESLVAELGLTVLWRRFPESMNKNTRCLSMADHQRLEAHIAQEYVPFDPLKDVSIADMAGELDRNRSQVRLYVGRRNEELPSGERRIFYPRRTSGIGKPGFCLHPPAARAVMDELGRQMSKGAVLLNDLSERLDGLPENEVRQLLRGSPYRWNVVTRQVHKIEDDVAWLAEADTEAFVTWAKGDRQNKSTFGLVQSALGSQLDEDEYDAADHALFDLSLPRKVEAKPAELLAAAAFDSGRQDQLTDVERQALDKVFRQRARVLEVVASLVATNHIPRPARPMVINMPRYLAAHFDDFMATALNKVLKDAA